MPEDFLKCVREGGKVVTKKIDDKRYIHICYVDILLGLKSEESSYDASFLLHRGV